MSERLTSAYHSPRLVDGHRVAGAFLTMDQKLSHDRPHVLARLAMPETERLRGKEALREGRIRIAAVMLRDTYDKHGDAVELSGADETVQLPDLGSLHHLLPKCQCAGCVRWARRSPRLPIVRRANHLLSG